MRLTTRAAVLALLACAMTLALTVPLREFFSQRALVADLRRRTSEQQQRVDELQRRKAQLVDPEYVEELARERLYFVLPGETPFIVLTPSPSPSPTRVAGGAAVAPTGDAAAWYDQLWSTVEVAGRTPSPKPTPRATPTR